MAFVQARHTLAKHVLEQPDDEPYDDHQEVAVVAREGCSVQVRLLMIPAYFVQDGNTVFAKI